MVFIQTGGYTLDGVGSAFYFQQRQKTLLFNIVQTGSGTRSRIQWAPGVLSQRVKRPGREADDYPPSTADVKNGGTIPPLSPLCMPATSEPIVQACMIDECAALVEWKLEGETEVLGGYLAQYHFDHHKSHMTWLWTELGSPRWEAGH
jgi:hypothetical protein